jgi:aspartate ammonia-lyase
MAKTAAEKGKRMEKDVLGEMAVPEDALYGIHALRARQNFPGDTPFPLEWYRATGVVKKACYLAYEGFMKAAEGKYPGRHFTFRRMDEKVLDALVAAADEVSQGTYFDQFIVPAVMGGAGTSINMNVNEIIANAALLKLGKKPGSYDVIDPVEHANVFQSTNDVIPTALRVAVMQLLITLEQSVNDLRQQVEQLEKQHRNDLRPGYTQMQEAVPASFGTLFSTYSEALSRDWWRVSKCFERIKTINLGGGAIGTGLTIPRYFIIEVANHLQQLTGLPLTRSENMPDVTSNLDAFVEVHAILKAHAVNLEKMVSDIRLLASDIGGNTLSIPRKQVGSSIMPGKINPVIPEFAISAAHRIYANDSLVASLSAQGCLELNAYLPVIGHAIIESLKMLVSCDRSLKENLLQGLMVHTSAVMEKLYRSPSVTTALLPYIGYHKASELAVLMKSSDMTVFEANRQLGLLDEATLESALKPENLLKMGYSLNDLESMP